MAISGERIRRDLEAIARCTHTPGAGASRPTFSAEWGKAVDYVRRRLEAAGCESRWDGAGNLRARQKSLGWEKAAWLCGSHLDTVPHGGDYDGAAGVVTAMEVLSSAAEDSIAGLAVELIVFAEEEGTTFGLGMIGSRAMTGELDAGALGRLKNSEGQSYLEAGKASGVEAGKGAEGLARLLGMIEVHIEQGPGMWRRGQALAAVSAIAGRRQYKVVVRGHANHAGATSMSDRQDALAGVGEIIVALEGMARAAAPGAVITVGRLVNHPNAINVIADRVEFTIDWRAAEDGIIERGAGEIEGIIRRVCGVRGLQFEVEQTEAIAACPMDERLMARLGDLPRVVSGALHDSAVMARHLPTAMLFVPSRDGISHHPGEFSRVEDIAQAASAVERVVRRRTIAQLNAASEEEFAGVCGRWFEHSPWIARRAWAKRPFSSGGDLHAKMCAIVAAAGGAEQVGLIRAHPDLVGTMALTAESSGEQAAAGLGGLAGEEAALFRKYNAAYRARFEFPFVICARQNKKEAILAAFPPRLAASKEQEIAAALGEIYKIARLRMADALWEDGQWPG